MIKIFKIYKRKFGDNFPHSHEFHAGSLTHLGHQICVEEAQIGEYVTLAQPGASLCWRERDQQLPDLVWRAPAPSCAPAITSKHQRATVPLFLQPVACRYLSPWAPLGLMGFIFAAVEKKENKRKINK